VTAILSPVTLADVERYAPERAAAHAGGLDAISYLAQTGHYLEATTGRALIGATAATMVARGKRRAYEEAVAEWEASPDSSTRHAVFDAAAASGLACAGCGMIPAMCASDHRYGCHPK
jgi:hypothetical protein